jgi:hypothetical protein
MAGWPRSLSASLLRRHMHIMPGLSRGMRQIRTFTSSAAMHKYTARLTVHWAIPGTGEIDQRSEDPLIIAHTPAVLGGYPGAVGERAGGTELSICRSLPRPRVTCSPRGERRAAPMTCTRGTGAALRPAPVLRRCGRRMSMFAGLCTGY